ncbi:hypothetical protein [Elizabethkingia miricola]|uniref:hypothetical protein n=1 Tax=Elizabethkingia miricola TaxID=172045 RepID=UPI003892A3AE
MTKTAAIRKLKELYKKFGDNLYHTINFQIRAPDSIELFELEKSISIAKLQLNETDNEKIIENLYKDIKVINELPKIVHPMTIVYGIAHFEVFLADIVKLLYTFCPKALSSKDKMLKYEQILQYESMEELITRLIDEEVNAFSFKSIKERVLFLEKKFGLKFEFDKQNGIRNNWNCIEMKDLIEIHSTRNLIVHNNSIVNKFYTNDNPQTELKEGSKRIIDHNYANHALFVLFRVSSSFHDVVKKKINNKRLS